MKSTMFSLNWSDLLKGLVMAILTPVAAIIIDSINKGTFTMDWTLIWHTAVAGAVGYLIKNFFTNDIPSATKTLQKAGITNIAAAPNDVELQNKK